VDQPENSALNEREAAAQISALINPKPDPTPKGPDGKFVPRNPQPEPQAAEADTETQPVEEEAPQQQAAPDDEDIEIDEGDEAEATQPSSLDMPASWGQTAREYWESFTPEQQQFLAQHDSKRTSGLSRQANELKAAQEQVRAQTEAAQNQLSQLAQAAQRLQSETVKRFQAKFKDVTDIQKLAAENPARFVEFQAAAMEVQASQQEAAAWQQAVEGERAKQLSDFRAEENAKLAERFGLDDDVKARAFQDKVTKFATDIGIPEGRLAQYTAEEIALLEDARKYRAALAKRQTVEKSQAPKPPKVIKPGAPVTGPTLAAQSVQKLSAKLHKTGSHKDAAELLKARWRQGTQR
jgi:hypothetical protein